MHFLTAKYTEVFHSRFSSEPLSKCTLYLLGQINISSFHIFWKNEYPFQKLHEIESDARTFDEFKNVI